MKYAKKTNQTTSGSGNTPKVDEKTAKTFEAILELMTLTTWDDGSPRTTATLTFFAENGGLKACLNDRDQGQTAWMTGSSFVDVLQGLEKGIRDDSLEWRAAFKPAGKSPPRRTGK